MQNRPIRSFARRIGRMTTGAKNAISTSEFYKTAQTLQLDESKELSLDIGFGMGDSILALAEGNPERQYVGVEVHTPGVGRVLSQIEHRGINNIQVIESDVMLILDKLPQFDEVLLWFPDPWPKKRHHKRRIVQDAFLEKIASILKPGGRFHMATDWENYAEHMRLVAARARDFTLTDEAPERPSTKFARRGDALGHGQWDIVLVKNH